MPVFAGTGRVVVYDSQPIGMVRVSMGFDDFRMKPPVTRIRNAWSLMKYEVTVTYLLARVRATRKVPRKVKGPSDPDPAVGCGGSSFYDRGGFSTHFTMTDGLQCRLTLCMLRSCLSAGPSEFVGIDNACDESV